MANEFTQQSGDAILQIEVLTSDSKFSPLIGDTAIPYKAEINETCRGYSSATFYIRTTTRDYVDKLLKDALSSETPRLRWRLGIGSTSAVSEWIPWQDHIIKSSGSSLEGLGDASGYLVVIHTADLLWEIDRINRVAARKGKISDIVRSISDYHELPSVVEPTTTSGLYYQSYTGDCEFILKRMAPRAINDKNRGNYQFYLRDGTLHFHTIDYQSEIKTFNYYGAVGAKLTAQDHTQDYVELGAAGVRVIYYDPYTGDYGATVSKPENTLKLSNTSPDTLKLSGAELNLMLSQGTNRAIDQNSISSNTFEEIKSNVYTLKLTLQKSLFFRANDLCRIIVNPGGGQVPPSSGIYQVSTIKHIVDKSSLVSNIVLRRGEIQTKDSSHTELTQAGEAVVQPKHTAAGQDPNLKSVSSSSVTRGSGKQMSTAVTVDTHDPDSAPA